MGLQRTREGKKGEIGSKKAKPACGLTLELEVRLVTLVGVGVGDGVCVAVSILVDCHDEL